MCCYPKQKLPNHSRSILNTERENNAHIFRNNRELFLSVERKIACAVDTFKKTREKSEMAQCTRVSTQQQEWTRKTRKRFELDKVFTRKFCKSMNYPMPNDGDLDIKRHANENWYFSLLKYGCNVWWISASYIYYYLLQWWSWDHFSLIGIVGFLLDFLGP